MVFLLLFLSCAIAYEDVPLLIDTSSINFEIEKNDENVINVDDLKKAQSVVNAQTKTKENQKPRLKLDTRQIHQQRTLQYMDNRGSGTMLPIF